MFSSKSEKDGFTKVHNFELNMAHYLNNISEFIDVTKPQQTYF